MSKKNSRKRKNAPKGNQLAERARQNLEKGNFRQALKDARVCFRSDGNDTHRRLLERALAGRAGEHHNRGNLQQAQITLGELLLLGPTDPEVMQRLPRLQILIGAVGPGGAELQTQLLQANPSLLNLLADRAVLCPQRASDTDATTAQEARAIRTALQAIEVGQATEAAQALQQIPRQSPFADWKLFARGLAAFYAHDWQRMQANWDRLDPDRTAQRIADVLLVASGRRKMENVPADLALALRRLEYACGDGDPIRGHLTSMNRHWQAGRIRELLRGLHTLRARWQTSHPALLEKITEMLWKKLVREQRDDDFETLTRAASAPPLDPHWHRARALLAEQNERDDPEAAQRYWRLYLADLQRLESLSPQEQKVAAGLVYQRLARHYRLLAQRRERRPTFGDDRLVDQHTLDLRQQAIGCYQDSVRHCPQLLDSHRELIALWLHNDKIKQAAQASLDLLQQFPDDYETLLWLAEHYLEKEQPREAEKHAQAAHRVKPRDPRTATLLWNQRIGMVRHCTRQQNFQLAREELAAAAKAAPPGTEPVWLDALRATIEYRAKNHPQAEEYLKSAFDKLEQPTCVYLIMHANAVRYGLSRDVKNDFRDRFQAAVKKSGNSQTAGQMARFLLAFLRRKTTYTGYATHQRLVISYLQRCRTLPWRLEDLRHACTFLWHIGQRRPQRLLEQLLATGRHRFAREPLFPFLSGMASMEAGPARADPWNVKRLLKQALELNEQAETPLSGDLVLEAKQTLVVLDRYTEDYPFCQYDDDDEYDDDDDDEFIDGDEFDDDDGWFAPQGWFGDDAEISRLGELIPPGTRAKMEAFARARGMNMVEMLRALISGDIDIREMDAASPGAVPEPKSHAASRARGRKTTTKR